MKAFALFALRGVVAVSITVFFGTKAAAATYENTVRGFSLTYPDGWAILSAEDLEESSEAVKDATENAGGHRRDPRALVITEAGVEPPELAAHINVVITPGAFSPTRETYQSLIEQLHESRAKAGLAVELFSEAVQTVGQNEAIFTEYEAPDLLTQVDKRYWQIVMFGREQVYTVICAVPRAEAERYREVCRTTLESFRKDVGVEGFLTKIPRFFRESILYGIIGSLSALAAGWWRRRKGKPASIG